MTGLPQDSLLSGEEIIWPGQPGQGIIFTSRDVFLIPFSLLWGGFAIFWESTVLALGKAPFFFKLWGIPFVLLGLYFIVGRFFLDAWLRRGLRYAVTNKRILIYRPAPFSKLTALNLSNLPQIQLSEGTDGRGTIRFGSYVNVWGPGASGLSPALDKIPQFIRIENSRKVFQLIENAVQDRK